MNQLTYRLHRLIPYHFRAEPPTTVLTTPSSLILAPKPPRRCKNLKNKKKAGPTNVSTSNRSLPPLLTLAPGLFATDPEPQIRLKIKKAERKKELLWVIFELLSSQNDCSHAVH